MILTLFQIISVIFLIASAGILGWFLTGILKAYLTEDEPND